MTPAIVLYPRISPDTSRVRMTMTWGEFAALVGPDSPVSFSVNARHADAVMQPGDIVTVDFQAVEIEALRATTMRELLGGRDEG